MFTNKFSLRRHTLIHTKEKRYACTYCNKMFSLPQYLKEHIYTHTQDKPYVCAIAGCQERFRHAGKLSLHRKTHPEYVPKHYNYKLNPKKDKTEKHKAPTEPTSYAAFEQLFLNAAKAPCHNPPSAVFPSIPVPSSVTIPGPCLGVCPGFAIGHGAGSNVINIANMNLVNAPAFPHLPFDPRLYPNPMQFMPGFNMLPNMFNSSQPANINPSVQPAFPTSLWTSYPIPTPGSNPSNPPSSPVPAPKTNSSQSSVPPSFPYHSPPVGSDKPSPLS